MIKTSAVPNSFAASMRVLLITLCMALCVTWLYRQQILNGFTILAGDRYDGVISTTILEHWYNVFRGKSHWLEVNYFFPHVRSLANTDGYFLVGLVYLPFRLAGIDPFASAELANMAIKCIGYLGMYWMCRRVFSLPVHWSLLAAILFTLSNGMTAHSSRSQLATVAFTPFMVILLWNAGQAIKIADFRKVRRHGAMAGVLFGAWCLTCFYAAWFFLYFFLVFAAILLFRAGKPGLLFVKQQIQRHAASYGVVLAIALIALGPFLYAFFPKSQETGVRSYRESLAYTVTPENVLQLGTDNIFVGKAYNEVLLKLDPDYLPSSEYYNTGFAILLFILFGLAAVRIAKQESKDRHSLLLALMLATVVTWLTTLNIGGRSLWYAVFHLVPGAKALRVVSAYYIFLALPIIVMAVRYLAIRRVPAPVAAIIAVLLILEELNAPALGLVRKAEMERMALHEMPPPQCKAFYTSGWKDQSTLAGPAEIYAHNVTAMLIAQNVSIPTVNGIASFMAKDWDFANPNTPDYDARVRSYASKNGLTGLCRLDLNDKTWDVVDQATIRTRPLDLPFYESSAWDGGVMAYSGLSTPEPWGIWSNGKVIKFEFTEPLPAKFKLHVTGHAFAHNNGKNFTVILHEATSGVVSPSGNFRTFTMSGEEDVEHIMHFENPSQSRILSIIVPEPVSPMELGAPGDDRLLGLALAKMRVEAVD